jgi:hypothetical protein
VTFNTLCGAFCRYLLRGFSWTEAYDLIEFHRPHSIIWQGSSSLSSSWSDLLYFSLATLTTAGYDDVIPFAARSRPTALLESAYSISR